MVCRKCGKEIPDGSAYCNLCGAKQAAPERKPRKRGNGEGSVYQNPTTKKWRAVIILGYYEEDGRLRKKTKSKSGFATKRDALRALEDLKAGTWAETRPTMGELFDRWISAKEEHVGGSTVAGYRAAWKWMSAEVAWRHVDEVTIDQLQSIVDSCPRMRRTQEDMRSVIKGVFAYAIPRGYATVNLGEYIRVYAKDGDKKPGLPLEIVLAIRDAVGQVPYADYVFCQIMMGWRPSELLALRVQDYNPEERAFRGGAKTEAGRNRVVPVAATIQPIVDRLVRGKVGGYVFCAADGTRMSLKVYSKAFYDLLDALGVENPTQKNRQRLYTPHSCRHTFATLIKDVDGPEVDRLRLIGHADSATLRGYQDTRTEDLRRIVDAIAL